MTRLLLAVLAFLACGTPKAAMIDRPITFLPGIPSRVQLVSVTGLKKTDQQPAPTHCVVAGTVWDPGCQDTILPLPGVSVCELGTNRRAVTDAAGRYRLDSIPAGPIALEASFIGYSTAVLELELDPGDSATVNFKMGPLRLLER
jgi:hypothetical protein